MQGSAGPTLATVEHVFYGLGWLGGVGKTPPSASTKEPAMPLRAVHKTTREVRGWAIEGNGRRWLAAHSQPDDWEISIESNASWNCHLQNRADGRPHDGVPIYEPSDAAG